MMGTQADNQDTMLTAREVALAIGVCVKTLRRWRARGEGPLSVELPSGHVRYPSAYLQVWLAARAA